MARKSRKVDFVNAGRVVENTPEVKTEKRFYRAGLYARLSFESETNRERGTIENQMELLKKFVDGCEDIVVEREYMDISKTGTNFERDGFEEMLRDIRDGRIDCVIVKDLSRLGRNYVEAGNYVERVFPFFEVRFIAVTDGYDSLREDADLSVCMSNIFNEYYSRDLGKKIKTAYRSSWKEGKNMHGNIAYGLKKDPMDKHRLIADLEAAPVVQRIFELFVNEEMGYAQIARILNEEGIIGPKAHKDYMRTKELPTAYNPEWRSGTISHILCNPYYVGDSRHNQHTNSSFAEQRQKMNPKEEWILIENTHEPIVPKELYGKAQERLEEIHKKSHKYGKKNDGEISMRNFYKKKIVCGECGSTMYLVKGWKNSADFVCGGHTVKKICIRNTVKDTVINDEVLRVIRTHMNVYLDSVQMLQRMNQKSESMQKYDVLGKEIAKLHRELKKLTEHRQQLYADYVSKLIDAEQYETFAEQDAVTEKEIRQKIEEMTDFRQKYDKNYCGNQDWKNLIEKYRNIRHLTKNMVDAFVEKIEVFPNGRVSIHLLYDDMLKELAGYTKERQAQENGK